MHQVHADRVSTTREADTDFVRERSPGQLPSHHTSQVNTSAELSDIIMTTQDRESGSEAAIGPALLDYQQLSVWLNDSVRHLRRLVDEKRIPYIKVGHFVRFDPAAISEWLASNRRGTNW
jgi:excisionase family DNA binding protein